MGGAHTKREIDPEIQQRVQIINLVGKIKDSAHPLRTLASCSGHGKYPPTIVVFNRETNEVSEWFSGRKLPHYYKNGKNRKRFYKRDPEGFYYIPEDLYLD